MTVQEALYHQEVLMLAYTFLHPDELKNLQANDFTNIATRQMFSLMSANYRYNDYKCVSAYQIIDGMAKNKRFQKLLDQVDLAERVLSGQEEFIISKIIFDQYLKISRERKNRI